MVHNEDTHTPLTLRTLKKQEDTDGKPTDPSVVPSLPESPNREFGRDADTVEPGSNVQPYHGLFCIPNAF